MAFGSPKHRSNVDARDVAALSEASGGFGGANDRERRDATKPGPQETWGWTGVLSTAFLVATGAYYALNYYGGPEFDYLKIPLPLVPHTQQAAVTSAKKDSQKDQKAQPTAKLFGHPPKISHDLHPAGYTVDLPSEEVDSAPVEDVDLPTSAEEKGEIPELFPVYSSDELGAAFIEARQAIGCATCNSTGSITTTVVTAGDTADGQAVELEGEHKTICPTCRGKPGIRLNQQAYVRLCRLSGTLTFVAFEPDDPQVEQRKQAVRQLLLRTAGDRSRVENLGRLAGLWLSRTDRDNDGVLLAGTVQDVEQQGSYWATRVMLFGLPHEVTVLSAARVPWEPRQRVLVAGSIVENPSARLPGYAGRLPQVVWGGLPLRLPDEAR